MLPFSSFENFLGIDDLYVTLFSNINAHFQTVFGVPDGGCLLGRVQSDSFVLIGGCKEAPLGSIGSISSILIRGALPQSRTPHAIADTLSYPVGIHFFGTDWCIDSGA